MISLDPKAKDWLKTQGFAPSDDALWVEALTHGSTGADKDYERLEFLGDRVLGLVIAEWLYEAHDGPEGKLSLRLNALVSRVTCAKIAAEIGLSDHIRLGKQARDDGGKESTNILGDVMESLIGAAFTQDGFGAARTLIRTLWEAEFSGDLGRAKHPKSALQEWAAGNRRKPPEYELVDRSGPDHAAQFTVRVSVNKVGEAQATASNKQEAERRAAAAFMEQYG
ncbi:MAG: ribonuclease III [Erythrobacter sp.]